MVCLLTKDFGIFVLFRVVWCFLLDVFAIGDCIGSGCWELDFFSI